MGRDQQGTRETRVVGSSGTVIMATVSSLALLFVLMLAGPLDGLPIVATLAYLALFGLSVMILRPAFRQSRG